MKNENLTPRELQALEAIKRFIAENGWAPTVQELGDLLGLRSKSWAHGLLIGLEKKGYICLGKGPRMIRINLTKEGKQGGSRLESGRHGRHDLR